MKTIDTLKKRNSPLTWFVLALSFIVFVPSLLMGTLWIDLKRIHVSDGLLHDPIIMEVDRTVKNEFRGTFTVTVRREDGELVCQGYPQKPIIYKKARELPDPLLLAWWLGGSDVMERCDKNGFSAGRYFLTTCQTVLWFTFDYPVARRCVESKVFVLVDETSKMGVLRNG